MAEVEVDCVIPTHGRPQYLREALTSVLAQTCPPSTVTVVSDDDDLESREVVAGLQVGRTRPQLAFVHRRSGAPGASASRNLGAQAGGSPVLAFLDDDDTWEATYLEHALARLACDRVDAVVTATQKFSPAGPGAVKVPLAGLDARGAFRRSPGVTGSNIVLLRSAFDAVGGFDPSMPVQNDRDFFLRLLLSGVSYAVEPVPLVGVRQHAQGRLTDATDRRADGILLFEAKHGARFSWWDRRTIRYLSHYTRMSAASSRAGFVRSATAALLNWSPTVARDLPLDVLHGGRVQKIVKELVTGAW